MHDSIDGVERKEAPEEGKEAGHHQHNAGDVCKNRRMSNTYRRHDKPTETRTRRGEGGFQVQVLDSIRTRVTLATWTSVDEKDRADED